MNILSVCRLLPTPKQPTQGVFVLRRLEGMSEYANVRALQPVPFFPLLRPRENWLNQTTQQKSLQVTTLPMFYFPGVFKQLDAYWMASALKMTIQEYERVNPIDMLDAHWGYPEAVACQQLSRRFKIPFSVTLRGHEEDYLKRPGYRKRLMSAFHEARVCICVSQSLADLITEAGIAKDKVHVIHNGIDRSLFNPGPQVDARACLNLSEADRIVLSVGNLLPVKGHSRLIRAMRRLVDIESNTRLLIAGSTAGDLAYTRQLNQLVAELGLADHVRFLGSVSNQELVAYYRAADVFALLSEREGCCNAVLEALACGTPVVASPAGDNAVFVGNNNGSIVSAESIDEVSSELLRWMRMSKSSKRISETLRLRGWREVGRDIVKLMESSN